MNGGRGLRRRWIKGGGNSWGCRGSLHAHVHTRLTGVPVCNITRSHYLLLACWPSRENARGLVYLRIPSNSHEMLPWYRSDVKLPGTFPSNAFGSTISLSLSFAMFDCIRWNRSNWNWSRMRIHSSVVLLSLLSLFWKLKRIYLIR